MVTLLDQYWSFVHIKWPSDINDIHIHINALRLISIYNMTYNCLQVFVGGRSTRSTEEGLIESDCELEAHHIGQLQRIWEDSMATANSLGMLVRHRRSVETQWWCPYTSASVSLGDNTYPTHLINRTCLAPADVGECAKPSIPEIPDADITSGCKPIPYNVPVLRYSTIRIQTMKCVIDSVRYDWVPIVAGCACAENPY